MYTIQGGPKSKKLLVPIINRDYTIHDIKMLNKHNNILLGIKYSMLVQLVT